MVAPSQGAIDLASVNAGGQLRDGESDSSDTSDSSDACDLH